MRSIQSRRTSVLALIGSLLLTSPPSTSIAQKKTSIVPRLTEKDDARTWTRYTPETDKFVVRMPKNPTVQQEVRAIAGQALLLSYYGARRGESVYAVLTIAGLTDANWRMAHMLMLDFFSRVNADVLQPQGFQGSSTVKATYQTDISLANYEGRQFTLETLDKTGEWRLYKVDKTFYAVAACSSANDGTSSRRFLASFTFPNLQTNLTAAVVAEGERVASPMARPANRWLIILQTFSKHERSRATQRMNLLRSQGYDAHVISTSAYPNLRPGLLTVAMGPYSKRTAEARLAAARSVAPQSYIKPGW